MTPEEREKFEKNKKKRDFVSAFSAAQNAAKNLIEKVRRELDKAEADVSKITSLGYPEDMGTYYSEAAKPVAEMGGTLLDRWARLAKLDTFVATSDEVDQAREEVEQATRELEANFKALDPKPKQLKKMVK